MLKKNIVYFPSVYCIVYVPSVLLTIGMILMCLSRLSVLIARKLCILSFFCIAF